jgi:hypothetical protein
MSNGKIAQPEWVLAEYLFIRPGQDLRAPLLKFQEEKLRKREVKKDEPEPAVFRVSIKTRCAK